MVSNDDQTYSLHQLREACFDAFGVEKHIFDGAVQLAGFTSTDEIQKADMEEAIFVFMNRPVK